VGVFAGTGFGSYAFDNLFDRIHRRVGAERYATVIANDKDFAALRIAYKLGLTGPAVSVGTACSTGLGAVTLAVQALREGRCRVALAGAAAIGLTSAGGYLSVEGGIGSPSGRCRPFDAQADGTVGGSGAAMVALKRLSDAQADGDRILAVIRGVGCRNDGAERAAFTAPGAEGQAATLAEALADAGIDPASVGFVEGHGTGTALGDPIEVAGLNRAYRAAPPGSILLGSAKSNLGHLDAAAGLAGLIKAILALRHGVVPPTAGFVAPNPQAPFAEGPFRVNAAAEPWPERADGLPRRAAVSSFGLGGTNAHVILEQAPDARPDPDAEAEPRPEILALSAAPPAALDRMTADLAARLTGADAPSLADAAHTLQTGRRRLPLRRAVVARTSGEAAAKLSGGRGFDGRTAGGAVGVAFLFPGQGSQYPGMGRALYPREPAFRATVDEAAEILKDTAAHAVRDLLLADPGDAEAARRLADTAITQPALFVVEIGIARVLSGWGIEPAALIGHSVGELTAACLAGTLPFPAALSLVAERGRLMGSAPRGSMLAVSPPRRRCGRFWPKPETTAAGGGGQRSPQRPSRTGRGGPQRSPPPGDRPSQVLNTSHAFHCA
jgi:acyl transferase domain-containing protein